MLCEGMRCFGKSLGSSQVGMWVCDALRGHVMFWKVPRKFSGGYVRLCPFIRGMMRFRDQRQTGGPPLRAISDDLLRTLT